MTAFKKPLCGLMAFILVFAFVAAVPVTVFAEDEPTTYSAQEIELNKEKNDEGLEYIVLPDGSSVEIVGYVGSEKEISVPSKINNLSVVSLGIGCFEGNKNLEVVKLHSDILTIGEAAFKDCKALKEVEKMDSVTTFGPSAFEGCTALTSFTMPDGATDVPARCFYGCTALEEVVEHKNLKSVANDAFEGSKWEKSKPDGVLNFGRVLYSYKGNVKNLVIPEGISIIEDYAFLGCKQLEKVTLGYDVEDIGLYAFQNCVNLKEVVTNDALGIISAGAFKGCKSLKAMDFSETTLAGIGYEAFSGCTSLGTVKLSETISEIGDLAFADTKIKTVDFNKNIDTVGVDSFKNVTTLQSINVVEKNKTYKSVDGVLYNKDGNELILFPAAKKGDFAVPDDVEIIKEKAFINSVASKVTFTKKSSLYEIGVSAFENSAIKAIAIPANVTKIANNTFKNAAQLKKVTINEGITYIGASAFEGCSSLKAVELPSTLVSVATAAFKNAGLTSVNTGDGLARISTEAFAGNKELVDLYIGKNVEYIADYAFKDCVKLTAVKLPASLKEFTTRSFDGCTSLVKIAVAKNSKSYKAIGDSVYTADGSVLVVAGNKDTKALTIANGTKTVAANAFDLAPNVAKITFPATVTEIEGNALDVTAWYEAQNGVVYAGSVLYKVKGELATLNVKDGTVAIADNAVANETVKVVTLPASLVTIGDGAFSGSGIATIVLPDDVTYIGVGAFKNALALESVTLSKNLTIIETAAFQNCSALKAIAIPAGVKTISADTFAGCKALATVELGKVADIEQYAFSGCTALKEVTFPATLKDCTPLAFYGCTALAQINVDEANKTYKSLDGVVIVGTVEDDKTVFDTIAIYPAGKKGNYEVPESIKNIADAAFYNCDALTGIIFKDGFENIGAEAFYDCDSIKTVTMPESARSIGSHAFASCDSLVEFVVNSNLTTYEENTFEGCYYFNYEAVTINVPDSSGLVIGIVAGVLVLIGVIGYLVYNKKQKKQQKEIMAKIAEKEALEATKAE